MKEWLNKNPALGRIAVGAGLFMLLSLADYCLPVYLSIYSSSTTYYLVSLVFCLIAFLAVKAVPSAKLPAVSPSTTFVYCLPALALAGLYVAALLMNDNAMNDLLRNDGLNHLLQMLLINAVEALIIAFWQEMLSKGLMANGVVEKIGNTAAGRIAAAAAVGLLFAAGGRFFQPVNPALKTFTVAFFIAAIYLRSGNIVLCIFLSVLLEVAHVFMPMKYVANPSFAHISMDGMEFALSHVSVPSSSLYPIVNAVELYVLPASALLICVHNTAKN